MNQLLASLMIGGTLYVCAMLLVRPQSLGLTFAIGFGCGVVGTLLASVL